MNSEEKNGEQKKLTASQLALETLGNTFYTMIQFSITILTLFILIMYPPVYSRVGYTMFKSLEQCFLILTLIEGAIILLTHAYRENNAGHHFLIVSDILRSMCSSHGQVSFICFMLKSEIFLKYPVYTDLTRYVYNNAWYTQIFAAIVSFQLVLCLFGSSRREYLKTHAVSSITVTSIIIIHNLYYNLTF